jgi:hypothetical protein
LTIENSPSHGIKAYKAGGLNLDHVTLEDLVLTLNGSRGMEIHNDTVVSDMEITNCEFVSNGAQGLRTASNVIADGMVIADSKFNQNTYGIYLQGTISNLTILRSSFNDNIGAFSNGLPNSHGAYMTETGALTNLIIEDSEFKNNSGCGLMVWNVQDNADIRITRTLFQDNNKWGTLIWGQTLTNVLIESSSVLNNAGLGIGYYGIDFFTYGDLMTNVSVHYTNITGHTVGGGVKNRNTVNTAIVDATANWWGDESGPYDPLDTDGLNQNNPNGLGDAVTEYVLYDPWIGQAGMVTGGGWIDSPAGAYKLHDMDVETVAFFNGFETDIAGWDVFGAPFDAVRVSSGTNGIASASGDWHAESGTAVTNWGGYNSEFPAGGYSTSVDIYLNVDGAFSNDTRFDWTSAINRPDGEHRRDFAFNGGFYSDDDGSPGSGLNRFIVSASNNTGRANSYPKNPGRDPIAIATTGWYTLQHRFYDSGGGILAVDLSILDSTGNVINTWTLSDPTDVIGDTVGGNRYGWFATNEFPFLAIDNSVRKEINGPTGRANFGFVAKKTKKNVTPDGNTQFMFKAGDLNFHSNEYDWLVVNKNDLRAQFKGRGTINGEGVYEFMLWTTDGDPNDSDDTFRIRIWEEDEYGTETDIYDNGTEQAIAGGSVVVHIKKK